MASDCDFLIPVNGRITAEQEAALRALHREIVTRPGHWTHHLEGSYPDRAELRTLDALGKEWLYIDHGHAEMEWSTHSNSEVATVPAPVAPRLLRRQTRGRCWWRDLELRH
jgi:hypothetical protein